MNDEQFKKFQEQQEKQAELQKQILEQTKLNHKLQAEREERINKELVQQRKEVDELKKKFSTFRTKIKKEAGVFSIGN